MDKNEKLNFFLKEVDTLCDGLYLPLDEKIKRPVAILRMLGFETRQSCEGHPDKLPKLGRLKYGRHANGICYPWIDIGNDERRDLAENYIHRMGDYIMEYNHPVMIIAATYPNHFELSARDNSTEQGQEAMSKFTEWLLNEKS